LRIKDKNRFGLGQKRLYKERVDWSHFDKKPVVLNRCVFNGMLIAHKSKRQHHSILILSGGHKATRPTFSATNTAILG